MKPPASAQTVSHIQPHRTPLTGLVAGVVAIGVEGLVMSPLLTDIGHELGADPSRMAWAVAAYGLSLALVAPPVGLWGGRLPRRHVMAMGLVVFVLASLLCAGAQNWVMLMLGRALCGVGAGMFLPACYAHVGDATPYQDRARVMGRVMAGWSVALIVGVPLGSAVGEWWGWRLSFAGVGLLATVAMVSVWRMPVVRVHVGAPATVRGDAAAMLRNGVPRLLAVNFLDMVGFYGVYTFLGAEVRAQLGLGSAPFGLLVLCYGVGLLFATLNARLLDRFGKQRSASIAMAVLVLLFAAMPWAVAHAGAMAAVMLAWGVLQGFTQTAVATLLTQAGGQARGFSTACMSCTTYMAVAVGAAGGGALLDAAGFAWLAWAAAGCAWAGSLLLRRVHRSAGASTAPG